MGALHLSSNLLRVALRADSWSEAERVATHVAPMVGEIASARTEGLLRRTVACPEQRLALPSTLSDVLDHIARRVEWTSAVPRPFAMQPERAG